MTIVNFKLLKFYPIQVTDRDREIMSLVDYETSTDPEVEEVREYYACLDRIALYGVWQDSQLYSPIPIICRLLGG